MAQFENNSKYELIDNENKQINEAIDKKEELIALGILKAIDIQITNHDMDLAIDRVNNKYYLISDNTESLKIPLNIEQLENLSEVLVKILNTDIQLFGSGITGRAIGENTWKPNGLENKIIESGKSNFSKNDIEELFVFVMNTKGIPMDEWEVESTVCANNTVNNECKLALGN